MALSCDAKKNLACRAIDFYVNEPTKDDSGFSINLYHYGDIHFDNRILGLIQDQISK